MRETGVLATLAKLSAYCRASDWAGYDPYDALNSRLFTSIPFLNSRTPRIVLTQFLKRSPVNVRRWLGIEKTQNPKGIALFLSGFVALSKAGIPAENDPIGELITRLVALRSPNSDYWCWGYSFPWQTRTIVVPRGAANLVCTTFAANGLLDAYELRGEPQCLAMALSAARYLLNELYWSDGWEAGGFAYPLPSVRVPVHNANLLAAALLCRVYSLTGEKQLLAPAMLAARYAAAKQRFDGSWLYGEAATQDWIDNFHTGFNLGALDTIRQYADVTEFDVCIERGFDFYRGHFFRESGAVRYFHDRDYPVDTHCIAQSIITLLTFQRLNPGNLDLAQSVFQWAANHMWNDRGFYYYRRLRAGTIRTSYMRWSQAWMFLAVSMLLAQTKRFQDNGAALRTECPESLLAADGPPGFSKGLDR